MLPSPMKQTKLVVLCFFQLTISAALAKEPVAVSGSRPVDGIMDNSFLIEEAYNQPAGVVQHIFTAFRSVNKLGGSDERAWDFSFTQEWPLFSQTHQLSYSVPYSHLDSGEGVGDILLNYRWQAYFDERTLTAFAPRFSLILPSGDNDRGLGDDTVGYQWNLPFSTTLGDHWSLHTNAGLTWLPNAAPSPRRDLVHYNLGASIIYAATRNLHFLVEWIGTWEDSRTVSGWVEQDFSSVISPGVRKAFNFRDDSQLVLGVAAPIGLTGSAPDLGLFLYVSYEHGF